MSFASVNGQTSTNIYEFSNHIKMLEGKKVKQKPSEYGITRDFYADKSVSRFYNGKKKGAIYSYKKDYSKINNKILTISKIDITGSNPYHKSLGDNILITFYNSEAGIFYQEGHSGTLYLDYELVEPLLLPPANEIYCFDFTEDYDKFEKQSSVYTGFEDPILFTKIVKEKTNQTTFFLRLRSSSSTPQALVKGVKLIFEDGEMMDYPEITVDYKVSERKYVDFDVVAIFRMDDELIKKMLEYRLTDYRLYINDGALSEIQGKETKEKLRCLVENTYKTSVQ